jgi:predicted kinase
MDIYILCGLSSSGKSTWAKKKAIETGAMIVNRDSLRTMLFGYYKFDKNYEYIVKNCAEKVVQELIDCNMTDVIIDECNLSKLARLFWINAVNNSISGQGSNLILVWFKEVERNVELRAKGDLRGLTKEYWREVIDSMKRCFVPPTLDEGFDEIIEIQID